MKKKIAFVFLLIMICSVEMVCAASSVLSSDLSGEVRYPLQDESEEPAYIYRYQYPQIEESDPIAALINDFYRYKVSDALDFEVPMMVDYYSGIHPEENIFVQISYEIVCNNDDYFSVLVKTEGNDFITYTGHTFSKESQRPGSSVALPYLLGLLSTEENDTWLEERQTAKADELVRKMVWDQLQANRNKWMINPDFSEDMMEFCFYPEEDFYLQEDGIPVFYLEPGIASDLSDGLLTFPIPLEEIRDEM